MRLVLIDGHAILHRAFHAYPPLTTTSGELVGAVYGFTSILLNVLLRLHPEYVAVAFDKKAPTFRHKKFTAYKAHRPAMDENLVSQIPRVHQVVATLNIPIFELDGYEADDVIGTLANQAKVPKLKAQNSKLKTTDQISKLPDKELLETIIVTGDQDALQLVDKHTKVFMPGRGKQQEQIFDEVKIKEKYGLTPKQIIDLKALAGDPSDGIPGVKGIGPKTATKLISRFGEVNHIYANLNLVDKPIARKLEKGKDSAYLSKELATIDTQVPIKLSLPCCTLCDYDKNKVINLFEKLEFASLIKKLPGNQPQVKTEPKKSGEQMGLF